MHSSLMVRRCGWVCLAILAGCHSPSLKQTTPQQPAFRQVYQELQAGPKMVLPQGSNREPRLTLSAEAMPVGEFLRFLANRAGISCVAESRLDGMQVSIEVVDQEVSDVLEGVARRLGVQVTRVGTLYFLGQLRPEDRGVLVRKVPRLSGNELARAVETLLSEAGRVQTFDDGLVVVGDRVAVLQRVHELLDAIERGGSASWVVQLYVVTVSDGVAKNVGLDIEPALDLSYTFAASSGSGLDPSMSGKAAAVLSGVIEAVRREDAASLLAEPLFLLVDGGEASIDRGERVPVPKRSVSDQGTVSTIDFEFIQTGLVINVKLRESSADAALLDLDFTLSDIRGYVADQAPIVNRQGYKSRTVINSGGVYLLGSLERESSTAGRSRWLSYGDRSEVGSSKLQIWARAYRIAPGSDRREASALHGGVPPERPGS